MQNFFPSHWIFVYDHTKNTFNICESEYFKHPLKLFNVKYMKAYFSFMHLEVVNYYPNKQETQWFVKRVQSLRRLLDASCLKTSSLFELFWKGFQSPLAIFFQTTFRTFQFPIHKLHNDDENRTQEYKRWICTHSSYEIAI